MTTTTEQNIELRINRAANRRHEIYRKLEDPLIGMAARELLAAEIEDLEADSEYLYRELRKVRAEASHQEAVAIRSSRRWPIVPMRTEEPIVEMVSPVDIVAERRQRRRPLANPSLQK